MIVENKGYIKRSDFELLLKDDKKRSIAILETQKGTDVAILDIPKSFEDYYQQQLGDIVRLFQLKKSSSEWKTEEGRKITKGHIVYYSNLLEFEGLVINYNNGNQIMSYKFIEI